MSALFSLDPKVKDFLLENNFADAAKLLLHNQKKNWKQLSEGYGSLANIKIKNFSFNFFNIEVQFNPKRLKSTSAKVDPETIKTRRCFLCLENLPEEQKGIIYKDDYIILCNPYPIFPEHFTITHKDHIPQNIKNSFKSFLLITRDLSKYYTVFYNGPDCGASAPDHLHFQAGTKNYIPLEDQFEEIKNRSAEKLIENEDFRFYAVNDGLRKFFSLESGNMELICDLFHSFYQIYRDVNNSPREPMMNILSIYKQETGWRVIIFVREKHRPAFFYDKEEDKILWSPAAVDLGGICVIPLEEDFIKISKDIVQRGFNEITVSDSKFSLIKEGIRKL